MDAVNEKSTSYLQVDFKDANGSPSAPSQVDYIVSDEVSGTVIRSNGSVAAGVSVVIVLDESDNTILNNEGKHEIRIVTVLATYGVADKLNQAFRYELINLAVVP